MKKIKLLFILFLSILVSFSNAQKCFDGLDSEKLSKQNVGRFYSKFNVNNISTFIRNNGDFDLSHTNDSGFEFPKGSNKTLVYESGLVWGGKIDGKIYVGGNTYNQGIVGGRILEDGTPQNPDDPGVRVYRVRADYKFADLSSEVNDEELTHIEIYNNYEKDWQEWPADWGAPFNDIDNNGIYNPEIDIPGIPGANQTLWFVANDFDEKTARSLYGSDPMKLEIQVTIWGYNIPQSGYDNAMFKKYKLINKSNVDIDSMYIAQWADADIGGAGDDYVGCDTLLSLSYAYNGDDDDTQYGSIIPAVGFHLLQGPLVNGDVNDIGYCNGKPINGKNNLGFTAFSFFIGGDDQFSDPDLGSYVNGTLQFYNLMQGRSAATGNSFIDPQTGLETKYNLSGNPITQTGWIDGILHPPGDRRSAASSGPFTLAVGDTQEVVIAQLAAMGKDRLNSVILLKEYASILKEEYHTLIPGDFSPIFINNYMPSIKKNIYNAYDIIELNINRIDSVENYSLAGYDFQGYNIYQYSQESNFNTSGKRLFTYDIVDDVTTITGQKYDPLLGTLSSDIIYNGTNSGFPDKIIIDKDHLHNSKLIKGKEYYYGISAYFYNRLENKIIETAANSITIIYQEDLAGAKYSDTIESITIQGNSDPELIIEIVEPDDLTGDTYEITFAQQHYYLDTDGEWKKTQFPDSVGKSLNKPKDQTPSRLIPMPSIYAQNNTINLHLMVENNAPDLNYIDAISITFPEGIIIKAANDIHSNHSAVSVIDGQTVTWGEPGSLSTDGPFAGGEELIININSAEPTFTIDYIIYDDGWSEAYVPSDPQYYNLGDGTVDGYGSVKLTGEIGHIFKTVKYWELTNKTTNELKLEEQVLFSNFNWSTWHNEVLWDTSTEKYAGKSIVDGFSIELLNTFRNNDGFLAPINFSKIELNEGSTTTLSSNSRNEDIDISNYTIFGGVISSHSIDNFGVGTSDFQMLEQDYELRFTGVYDTVGALINGVNVHQVIEGGSMATCFRMSSAANLSTNPLNPNFGTAEPFMVRIPFEAWNIEDQDNPFQVNLTYRDRVRSGTEDPFWAWNPTNRMYAVIVNSPYSDSQIIQVDDGPDEFNANATWTLVFYTTNYHLNDTVKITYANPIEFTDVIRFTTPDAPIDKISPNKYQVFQNYPNPFNPNTRIRYYIPEEGNVNITIYNMLGQKITQVINKALKAGKYETEFNGSKLATGIYFYRIVAGDFIQTKKMLLLK